LGLVVNGGYPRPLSSLKTGPCVRYRRIPDRLPSSTAGIRGIVSDPSHDCRSWTQDRALWRTT